GGVHAQGLRHNAHHARHRGAREQRLRGRGEQRLLPQRLGVSAGGSALGARLRERDLGAAPAALNLLESTAPEDREQARGLLAELAPARGAGEAPAHVIGVTGPPGAGESTRLLSLLASWRERGAKGAIPASVH